MDFILKHKQVKSVLVQSVHIYIDYFMYSQSQASLLLFSTQCKHTSVCPSLRHHVGSTNGLFTAGFRTPCKPLSFHLLPQVSVEIFSNSRTLSKKPAAALQRQRSSRKAFSGNIKISCSVIVTCSSCMLLAME